MIITIDGPSGSGKSTLAVNLAHQLNFFCLNSGYIYRGLAYVLKNIYGYNDQMLANPVCRDIQACLHGETFKYVYENGESKIYWVVDISQFLKDSIIAQAAVILAQNACVRDEIKQFQLNLVANKNVVVEGRSCGTYIFPQAEVKFYLDATVTVRAARFISDQNGRGKHFTKSQALALIEDRDKQDRERAVDPLMRPKDAIDLDSSNMNQDEILQKAFHFVQHVMK